MISKKMLLTIKDVQRETEGYINITFKKPNKFIYSAGQCFDIHFPHKTSERKTFSYTSAPSENYLMMSYKEGISEFKKNLSKLTRGEKIYTTQFGNMFTFNPELPTVFIAGGIGIAPFRSMIKNSLDTKIAPLIRLIYINRDNFFPFRKEFDLWQKNNSFLKIYYLITSLEGRLTKEKLNRYIPDIATKKYTFYIVGSPLMVDSTEALLSTCNIDKNYIKTDSFDGYNEE